MTNIGIEYKGKTYSKIIVKYTISNSGQQESRLMIKEDPHITVSESAKLFRLLDRQKEISLLQSKHILLMLR